LKDAALAQLKVALNLGVTLPSAMNWWRLRKKKKNDLTISWIPCRLKSFTTYYGIDLKNANLAWITESPSCSSGFVLLNVGSNICNKRNKNNVKFSFQNVYQGFFFFIILLFKHTHKQIKIRHMSNCQHTLVKELFENHLTRGRFFSSVIK
jgi:hypothetical protein